MAPSECETRSLIALILDKIRIRNNFARCLLSECYGTFILAIFVRGALAQHAVAGGPVLGVAITAGIGVGFAICSGLGVSGGHVNFALTFAFATGGEFPWRRVPGYFIAQLFGGFLAAAVTYGLYQDAFDDIDGGTREVFGENGTAGVFATYPQSYYSTTAGFFEQVVNTGLLMAIVMIVLDHRNAGPPINFAPLFFGLGVFICVMSFGHNAGAPLNPSADLSGRLWMAVAGYNATQIWLTEDGRHWWWIPILGPCLGASLGLWSYVLAISAHHPPQPAPDVTEKDTELEYKERYRAKEEGSFADEKL